jgi:hypothetical protein
VTEFHCRVCGLAYDEPTWQDGYGSCDICFCCGAEFGYEDNCVESTLAYREKWLAAGARWFDPELRPADWDLAHQLAQVPKEFGGPL